MRPRNLGCILLWFAFYAALSPRPAWAWGNDGHQVVAFIAADHLSTNARNHVAKILDADPSDPAALATKMADAAIRPDIEFRDRYPVTKPWHFVDLCLQDRESDIAKRFSGGGCVTEKIDEYADRLRKATYDQWGAYGDLAFLIHLVGDIHQPLHAATNADRGGNCIHVHPGGARAELHATWDTGLVQRLERQYHVSKGPDGSRALATDLENHYAKNPPSDNLTWRADGTNDIAWESTKIARAEIYQRLNLPVESCQTDVSCSAAPAAVQSANVSVDSDYLSRETDVVGLQLYKAGMRLSSLLNQIYP